MLKDFLKLSTIEDLIAYEKKLDLSHYSLHYKTNFISNSNKVVFNFSTVCDKYFDYLYKYSPLVTLSENEYINYKYQPKKLSLHIYETVELWSIILRLNNMGSILDFDRRELYLPITQIFEALNEIMILEKNEIILNKTENGL